MLTYAEQIQNALKNRYRYSGYFLYWYKSTNTDEEGGGEGYG